jgi:hypothetical protein
MNIRTESFNNGLESECKLNRDLFCAGLAVVAASAEFLVEFLPDGFGSFFILLGEGIAFRENFPIFTGLFQSF